MKSLTYREWWRRDSRFPGGMSGQSADMATSSATPSTPFYGGGKFRAVVEGFEVNAYQYQYQELGWGPTGESGRPHWPVTRPSEEEVP